MTQLMNKRFLTIVLAGLAAVLFGSHAPLCVAQTPSATSLEGEVRSQEEGPMEGVMVSAKRAGSAITVSVATDAQGRYRFPRNRLEPGKYSLGIRAIGYDLDGLGQVEVPAQKSAKADLKLRKTADLAAQLTNGEWLMSIPGAEPQKAGILNCTTCHTLQRVVNSRYDAAEFIPILQRMGSYASGSSPQFPQKSRSTERGGQTPERLRAPAEFLSSINLSKGSNWEYPLQTLPRPKGRATRVIVTEYDLPRKLAQPHDVIIASDGMAWYSDFGQQFLSRMDPKTGKVTEYPIPVLKPGFPLGGLDVREDKKGNIWVSLLEQGGIAKFDKKTQTIQTFLLPPDLNSDNAHISMMNSQNRHVDGKVWIKDDAGPIGVYRLHVASGKYEAIFPYGKHLSAHERTHSAYGLATDSKNNLFINDTRGGTIVRVDAKTHEVKIYPAPTKNAYPRRGHMDSQDRLWVAEFRPNQVAMFDTRSEQFQEWPLPTPYTNPYDAMVDKNGEIWTGGMSNDRVVRLDSKTGQAIEYLLPRQTNIRRVWVDNATTPPTFWVGNNDHAQIVKVEPLD